MEKQEVIDQVVSAVNRALQEQKPEMIYAVVGALQRIAHAGIEDADAQVLVTNLNWTNGNDTESAERQDNGSTEPNEDGTGPGEDMGAGGQHQTERTDQPDHSTPDTE